jgi:hypothetical protein
MSSITKLPERLRKSGALELERRLLDAAAREEPPPELIQRMASAVGVAAPSAPSPEAPRLEATSPDPAPAPAGAAAGSSSLFSWMAGTVALVAVGGVLWATRTSPSEPATIPAATTTAPRATAVSPAPSFASTPPQSADGVPASRSPSPASTAPAPERLRRRSPADLGAQIALIDAARDAVSAGAGNQALQLIRQYQTSYPAGSFQPEASAIRIEALIKLGRNAEAKALAERFVTRHKGSPLAERVARLSGITREP